MISRLTLAAVAIALPSVVQAQAYQCSPPASVERVRPDLPSESQPKRDIPIGSYTLAITWAPQYCRENGDRTGLDLPVRGGESVRLHAAWALAGRGRQGLAAILS